MIREANLTWQYQDTESGLIMPWYTLPTLQWLKEQDTSKWVVFEYGCGYSTIWMKHNCLVVKGVDDNKTWAFPFGAMFQPEKCNYVESVHCGYKLDLVIVDGSYRKDCLIESINLVKSGGYIIIDNYGQEDFPDTEFAEKLLEGWEKQLFKQPNHTTWVTAVFRKP